MIVLLLKNISLDQDIFKFKFLEISTKTMYICLKEIVQFNVDIKKSLKRLHPTLVMLLDNLFATQL